MKAKLFDNQLFVDDRGTFLNVPLDYPKFNFQGKRTYICQNFQSGTVRGFHYHKKEQKIFICLKGAAKFALLPISETDNETIDPYNTLPEVYILSENVPKALFIPAGYANAWQGLTNDTLLIGISDVTVEESIKDDIRFDPEKILEKDVWKVKWR